MENHDQVERQQEAPEEPFKQEKPELPDVLEHLKHAYFFELQRREEIEKRVQAPITILVGLIGGFFALTLQSLKYWHWGGVAMFFVCTLFMLIMTSYYFGKYMWPRDYQYVRLPMELLNLYRDVTSIPPKPKDASGQNHSEQKKGDPAQIEITRENFTDLMMEYYARPTSYNRDVNMKRSDYYAKGWQFLFFTLGIEGAWVVLYLVLAILSS